MNLVLVFCTDLYTERQLHKHFKEKRVYLEWFKLNLSDYVEIKGTSSGLPKTLYYRKGKPSFISNHKSLPDIKHRIKGFENYVICVDNKIYNIKRASILKKTTLGNSIHAGYFLEGKFIKRVDLMNLLC